MTDLRTAAQQALDWLGPDAPECCGCREEWQQAIDVLRAALAEPEGQREKEIEDLRFSLDFYQRRCEALQSWQSKMRDPERTIVCDILANGFTLDPAFAGDRYIAPPQRKPLTDEEAWKLVEQNNRMEEYADAAMELIRRTERAHGIGGNDD